MSRVTISMKAARACLAALEDSFRTADQQALTELRRAMEPKRKSPDTAGIALARELKRRANATRRAVGLLPLRSKREPSAWESQAKTARSIAKAQKRDRRASIREALVKRADGTCECGCGLNVLGMIVQSIPQVDHMFGRGRGRLPESEETCWLLRADCHRDKTNNHPDAATWWRKFIAHCARQGVRAIGSEAGPMRWTEVSLAAKRRLAFVETRSMLGAGLKERHRAKAEEQIQELEQKIHKAVFGEENQR